MTDRPHRLALVGIGKIARDQHLPAIAANPRFELVATVSRSPHDEGVPAFESIDRLLASGIALDAVSIATPPVGRADIAAAAIDAGLDVMIEKPPGATLAEVAALDARAAAAGRTLFASWHSREAAGVDAARDWLADRRVTAISILWREDIRRWHPGQDWILGPGGFGVFDPAINALSIASAILPQPLIVRQAEFDVPEGRASPLAARVRMTSGNAPASADFDFLHQGEQQWDILVDTEGGRLALRQGGKLLEIGGERSEGADAEYPRLYDRFATLIEARASDVDIAPLRLVADAFMLASRRAVDPFDW